MGGLFLSLCVNHPDIDLFQDILRRTTIRVGRSLLRRVDYLLRKS